MISLEMINFLVTAGGSAWLTMQAQKAADLAEERKHNAAFYTEAVAAAEAARDAEPKWKGFYWVRSAIALICCAYFFIIPLIGMLMGNVQIVIGYVDFVASIIPGYGEDLVMWIKLGSGAPDARVLVYDPVKNNIMLSIVGMYFGNQVSRRA